MEFHHQPPTNSDVSSFEVTIFGIPKFFKGAFPQSVAKLSGGEPNDELVHHLTNKTYQSGLNFWTILKSCLSTPVSNQGMPKGSMRREFPDGISIYEPLRFPIRLPRMTDDS